MTLRAPFVVWDFPEFLHTPCTFRPHKVTPELRKHFSTYLEWFWRRGTSCKRMKQISLTGQFHKMAESWGILFWGSFDVLGENSHCQNSHGGVRVVAQTFSNPNVDGVENTLNHPSYQQVGVVLIRDEGANKSVLCTE